MGSARIYSVFRSYHWKHVRFLSSLQQVLPWKSSSAPEPEVVSISDKEEESFQPAAVPAEPQRGSAGMEACHWWSCSGRNWGTGIPATTVELYSMESICSICTASIWNKIWLVMLLELNTTRWDSTKLRLVSGCSREDFEGVYIRLCILILPVYSPYNGFIFLWK